ncbi:short-chain dehydrogenase [Collybia nuda]|uniref:Short-chain dehydrogenase n=1 Tax=Collybia nuda TaxID=64659 RepID=A0A9P6CF25_9AGAR|nr:short-chain dehydrogenase [Collybia nuda]
MANKYNPSVMGSLDGRVALVTGGGTGIGLVIANAFAENGAKVYITGRRKEKLYEAAKVKVEGEGQIIALPMDVTCKESIKNAVKVVEEADGKLDILVNNAGIPGPTSSFINDRSSPKNKTLGTSLFEAETFEGWQGVFATNTAGPFFVSTAFLELLKVGALARPGETSSIINISSAAAHLRLSMNVFAYGATKVGVEHLTKTMATEFALQGIPVRVNAISPGVFVSELTAPAEVLAVLTQGPPTGALLPAPVKRAGRDEEIAMTAIYLASLAGGFTNGNVIVVDGGLASVNP